MVITVSVTLAILAVLAYAAAKRKQINERGGCPECGTPMPMYRKPNSLRQAFWGGWTCDGCGVELDRHGRERADA